MLCNIILPSRYLVAAVEPDIEAKVKQTLTQEPGPSNVPPSRLLVPLCLRLQILEWGHVSMLSSDPGFAPTRFIIQQHFWWLTLGEDISSFLAACDICADCKHNNRPLAGSLRPLPVPHYPWSHTVYHWTS